MTGAALIACALILSPNDSFPPGTNVTRTSGSVGPCGAPGIRALRNTSRQLSSSRSFSRAADRLPAERRGDVDGFFDFLGACFLRFLLLLPRAGGRDGEDRSKKYRGSLHEAVE
jgi:hypothetical protein